jgi:hypothetical protein
LFHSFSKYGKVEKTQIIKKPRIGKAKDFAYVQFASMVSAYNAVDDPNPPQFLNYATKEMYFYNVLIIVHFLRRRVRVIFAEPKTTLFIISLPRHLDAVHIRCALETYSSVCIFMLGIIFL